LVLSFEARFKKKDKQMVEPCVKMAEIATLAEKVAASERRDERFQGWLNELGDKIVQGLGAVHTAIEENARMRLEQINSLNERMIRLEERGGFRAAIWPAIGGAIPAISVLLYFILEYMKK